MWEEKYGAPLSLTAAAVIGRQYVDFFFAVVVRRTRLLSLVMFR